MKSAKKATSMTIVTMSARLQGQPAHEGIVDRAGRA